MSYRGPDFLESIAQGLRVRAMVEDIKYRREARQQQAELARLQIERYRQEQAERNFKNELFLTDIGAIPAAPGDTGQNDEAIAAAVNITPENRRRLAQSPTGPVRLPSKAERYRQSQLEAEQEGTIAGIKTKATEAVTNPMVDINLPSEIGGGTARVKQADKTKTLLDIYTKLNPDKKFNATQPDDNGNVTVYSIDPRTEEVKVLKVLDKAGKTKTASAGSVAIANRDAKLKALMDQWRPSHYAQLGITPEVVEAAKGEGRTDFMGNPVANPAAARIREADETLYNRALKSLENEARLGTQGTAPTAATAPTAPTGKGKAPAPGRTVKASQLSAILQHPNTQRMGIKDVNALRKALQAQGYEIVED